MNDKLDKKLIILLMLSVASINLIVGTIIEIAPMILKINNNLSPWLIGIFPTAFILVYTLLGTSKYINKISLKISFKKTALLYIFSSVIGLVIVYVSQSNILLCTYIFILGITACFRTLNLYGVVMLRKDNTKLMFYQELSATISGIIGLGLGQLLININPKYFLLFMTIASIISFVAMSFIKADIITDKTQKDAEDKIALDKMDEPFYKKAGLLLGVQSGLGTIFLGLATFLFIAKTNNLGYYKVFQSILIIIYLYIITKYLNHKNTTLLKVNAFRTITFILIGFSIILLTFFNNSIYLLISASVLIAINNATTNTLMNYIVNVLSNKEKEKHSVIFTYYFRSKIVISLFFLPISKIYNDLSSGVIYLIFFVIVIILLIMNYCLKHLIKKYN